MIKNYWKVAIRNLRRDKLNTSINILGLSLGFASVIIIFLFVKHEFSYDQFHENFEDIYRLTYDDSGGNGRHLATTAPPMGKAMVNAFPEVEKSTLFVYMGSTIISSETAKYYEENVIYADSNFLSLLTFPLEAGNVKTALSDPNSIVISKAMAEKYFRGEDPVGKLLTVNDDQVMQVKGVVKPLPANSHIQFDFLISMQSFVIPDNIPVTFEEWGWIGFHTYLKLKKGADVGNLESKLPEFFAANTHKEVADRVTLRLQPLKDIYFQSAGMLNQHGESGNVNHAFGLSAVAILILVIAGFNFMNITTAQSIRRNKEVGVRKVLGAGRKSLLWQYIGESIVMSIIGFLIGILLLLLIQSQVSRIFGDIFSYSLLEYGWMLLGFFIVAVLFGVGAGFYPSLLIARFQPISVLKGTVSKGLDQVRFRQFLIFLQFIVTIGIIAGSIIISKQMNYIRSLDPGFDKDQVLALHLISDDFLREYELAKHKLSENPHVVEISAGGIIDGDNGSMPMWSEAMPEDVPGIPMFTLGVYYNYFETMGINFEEGRGFSEIMASDSAEGVVINRAAAEAFGFKDDVIGQFLWVGPFREGKILGVTENFHYNTLHEKVQPLVMFIPDNPMEYILVRTKKGELSQAISSLQDDWTEISPEAPFEYFLTDSRLNELYKSEERFATLIKFFSFLSILVACMGLYGLVSIMVQSKTREIGIRKVLGASSWSLTKLLSRQFILLVLGANLIAWPISYMYMGKWLDNFAYKIELNIWPFLIAAVLVFLAALLTIFYHGRKAAAVNPASALKKE